LQEHLPHVAEILLVLFIMLSFSFGASLLDGIFVGATVAEVEALKNRSPRLGKLFESFQKHTDMSLSAVLAIDTGATCICSIVLGSLMEVHYGEKSVMPFSFVVAVVGFILTDILPKVLGIYYRRRLIYWSVYPLRIIICIMYPIASICAKIVDVFLPKNRQNSPLSDEAIILTARRGVRDGVLTSIEGDMVEHSLTLDDLDVESISSKKIFSINGNQTIEDVFKKYPEMPHARIPVFAGERTNFIGIVRRRDMLEALAGDEHSRSVKSLVKNVVRIPKDAKISNALEILLQHFQQIALIEDASHAVIGVLTIEDIFEYVIGREIFEYDDLASTSREDSRRLRMRQKMHAANEKQQNEKNLPKSKRENSHSS
jgi:CBS domain containing-hemolysin-like protein